MIRLKHILLEEKQIPNVLFISDNGTDKRKGYARKLISSGVVTGEIYTADSQPAEELVALVYYNISSGYYDAVVVQCSGLFDKDSQDVISSLESISDICNRKKIVPVFIELPTDKYIKSEKYTPIDTNEVNDWIRKQAHVSLSRVTDDIYFTSNGMRLDKEGQNIIYNKLKNIFSTFFKEDSEDIVTEIQPKNLRKLQNKLNNLGYTISKNEIDGIELGDSTKESIKQFQLKNSLTPTSELDKQTVIKLFSITAIPSDANSDPIKKIIKSKNYKGVRTTAMYVMNYLIDKGLSIAGAAGIAGNIQVDSNFKTDAINNNETAIGLVQWQNDKKIKFLSWCEKKKLDPLSLKAQLDYLWTELVTKYSLLTDKLSSIEDPQAAADKFANEFKNLSLTDSERKEYAQEFFDTYNDTEGDSSLTGIVTTLATTAGALLATTIKKHASIPNSSMEFFNQWKSIAKKHEREYGIPVSITLAQAAIESGFGRSGLTTKYNNFFGITGKYNGKSVQMRNKNGQVFTWRVYPTPEESFDDHASLLHRRYTPSVKNPTYVDWANSLASRGYAESNYGNNLIKFIKQNGLDEYDNTIEPDNNN
jgi:flagellum-specific peptidoglycan hydrolase FlgJ